MPLYSLVVDPSPAFRSGQWYNFPNGAVGSTVTAVNAEVRYAPVCISRVVTFTNIGVEITTAGSTGAVIRLGYYRDGGGYPSTLVADFGTVSGTGTSMSTMAQTFTLQPGWWWMAVCTQGAPTTTPTLRSVPGQSGLAHLGTGGTGVHSVALSQTGVSGALPATATPVGAGSSAALAVRVKTA